MAGSPRVRGARAPSFGVLAALWLCCCTKASGPPRRVVLVTLDGVRWQDVFGAPEGTQPSTPTPTLTWSGGTWVGDTRDGGAPFLVSNPVMLSLPGYQSLFTGAVQPCRSNDCGRVGARTLQERIRRGLRLGPHDVASIASWETMADAVESEEGAAFVNAGLTPLVDGSADAEHDRVNAAQTALVEGARRDEFTFAHARRYWRRHTPRFLVVGLNDADEYAHLGDWDAYQRTLARYVTWIAQLREELGPGVTLVVTTDHGRGDGPQWRGHGGLEAARRAWLWSNDASAAALREHVEVHDFLLRKLGL